MEIVGFVDEERLNGMFLSRDITELDYVKHHSQGMLDAYFSFIADNNLPDNNTSATNTTSTQMTPQSAWSQGSSIGSAIADFGKTVAGWFSIS